MSIKAVACDSGGKGRKDSEDGKVKSVTANAYNFWRRLRTSDGSEFPAGLHRRFNLVKGSSRKEGPRVTLSYPDSDRKDRHADARGEIPVLLLNGDALKDQIDLWLGGKREDGTVVGGNIVFANWLPDWFFNEVVAETKTSKGWENVGRQQNEAMDLMVYALAAAIYRPILLERIDWEEPPGWAADWDENDLVFQEGGKSLSEASEQQDEEDMEELGRLLA
jgi:phage terminase large subunit GpA-like protein